MNQKKFMDIERIKGDYALGFRKGDQVWIEEKYDGSNASIRYDEETRKLVAFSRKRELSFDMTLSGFYNYVQTLDAKSFSDTPNYVIFGEWAVKNAITYYENSMRKWYVYDIYDVENEKYLPQDDVLAFADAHGLEFINVFYVGEFIDWEHVQSFVGKSAYGDIGEGVVIKNQTRLNDPNSRLPFVVKIVGEKFQEVKKDNHIRKMEDPQKLQAKEAAMEIMEFTVTKRRVEKELYKMRDEGILPVEWCDKDMAIVAKTLPKRIYDDCMKEEKEEMISAGEYAGKFSGQLAMKYAREIIIGE